MRTEILDLQVDELEDLAIKQATIEHLETKIEDIGDRLSLLEARINNRNKVLRWLREWGTVGASITSAVGIVAICVTLAIFAFSGVKENAIFRTRTEDSLNEIKGKLLKLEAVNSPGSVLKEIGGLQPKAFAASLPALQVALNGLPSQFQPNKATLTTIADKLLATDDTVVGYWPTVLQFIRFVSEGKSPKVPPEGDPNIIFSHNMGRGFAVGTIENRIVELDGGELYDSQFVRCRIVFTSDPVRMQNVGFVDCVFEFPQIGYPSPYLKRASRILLASNFSSVTIPSL